MHPQYLEVSPDLAAAGLSTAVVVAEGIDNRSTDPKLVAFRQQKAAELAKAWRGRSIADNPSLRAYRTLHERFGVRDLPASPENLLSYIRRNRDLTGSGALIDCYNLVSAQTLISIGAHDLTKLTLPVSLRICDSQDRFQPLDGSPSRSCAGEYGYVDSARRIVCRLDVLQGTETAVSESSTQVVFFLQGNPATSGTDLLRAAWYLIELLQTFCGGSARLEALQSPSVARHEAGPESSASRVRHVPKIDVETFHRLNLKVGTVIETRSLESPLQLLEVRVRFGDDEARALVFDDTAPIGDLIGCKVVGVGRLFPICCGAESYTSTLLTAGSRQKIVILGNEMPEGSTLF